VVKGGNVKREGELSGRGMSWGICYMSRGNVRRIPRVDRGGRKGWGGKEGKEKKEEGWGAKRKGKRKRRVRLSHLQKFAKKVGNARAYGRRHSPSN